MEVLSPNWITEKHIDFEYKKYVLLGYLQHVHEKFSANELFPHLSSLIEHYKNIKILQSNKIKMRNAFPENVTGIDWETYKLINEALVADDDLMREIEQIVTFSIPQFEKYMLEGRRVYDFVESNLNITAVGLTPIRVSEGYLFLKNGGEKSTHVYNYQITLFEKFDERFRAIHTNYVCSFDVSLSNSYEQLKIELLRENSELPNPATYLVESSLQLPIDPTLLPIAKRMLVRHLQPSV